MCGPHRRFAPLLSHTLRRIPQAVGVVATISSKYSFVSDACTVSIPQAVGTVATSESIKMEGGATSRQFQYRKR